MPYMTSKEYSRNGVFRGASVAVPSIATLGSIHRINESSSRCFRSSYRPRSIMSTIHHEPSKSIEILAMDVDSRYDSPTIESPVHNHSIQIGAYDISLGSPRHFHEEDYVSKKVNEISRIMKTHQISDQDLAHHSPPSKLRRSASKFSSLDYLAPNEQKQ